MSRYQLRFSRPAMRDLERLRRGVVVYDAIWDALTSLADDPRPRQSKRLRGRAGQRTRRVGDYRIVYIIDDDARLVTIIGTRHRKDAYR